MAGSRVITATWTVTLDSVVLLSVADGDDMEGEPSIDRVLESQIQKFIGSTHAKPKGRKNSLHTLSFTRVKYHASVATAQAWLLTHAEDLPDEAASATIAIAGGSTKTLANALIVAYQARCEHSTTIARYQIIGGAIS